jgi:CheY-like chemotaxis protein
MSKAGEIILVEDDADDRELFRKIIKELNITNQLVWFDNTDEAYNYLQETSKSIFIIFSTVNLPGMNGIEFKSKIDSTPRLRKKSIPFVFYSSQANQRDINDAYLNMSVQGFFKKGDDYEESKALLKLILDYWRVSKHPNT